MEDTNNEIVFEIRQRGNVWKLSIPDEGDMLTSFPVYNKDGDMQSYIWAGGSSGKLVELFEDFPTKEDAIDYAEKLGAEKIRMVQPKNRKKRTKKEKREFELDF